MTFLLPLVKIALWNELTKLDIDCFDCHQKYAEWQEFCDKCGSDKVMIRYPKTDGHHFLNFGVGTKEAIYNEVGRGVTPETIAKRALEVENLDKKTKKILSESAYRAARFVEKAQEKERKKNSRL